MRLTVGSLFSGCAGMDLGFENAGYDVKWQCEIDKWCGKILNKHFPDTPLFLDANDLTGAEPVDILIGGFPCQPVSTAGRKDGIDDPRWLWPAYHRAICEFRPRYAVVENVSGLFNRGMGDVLGALALSGYDAEWFSLRSLDVGAPHRRKRVYILATDTNRSRLWEERRSSLRKQEEVGRKKDDNLSNGSSEGELQTASIADSISGRFKKRQQGWKLQLVKPKGQESSDSYGERREGEKYQRRQILSAGSGKASSNSNGVNDDGSMEGRERRWSKSSDGYFGSYEDVVRRWEDLFEECPDPKDELGRLSPYFVEWMMGFPQGWTEGVSKTQRLKMLGNSVQVQCAEVVANLLREKVNNE